MTILAIETSCDETGVAVLQQNSDKITVLAAAVASQINLHKLTGGVVPNVAAREHTKIIKPLIEQVLKESSLASPHHQLNAQPRSEAAASTTGVNSQRSNVVTAIDAIAVTVGPGLQPALGVGVTAAQTLAYAWDKPFIPVHHIEGHIYSALLRKAENSKGKRQNSKVSPPLATFAMPDSPFPTLALIVSGGHTQLILMNNHGEYQVIGTTRDDAAGEAFDKVARMLDLGYPGGPAISKLAANGDPTTYNFTRPMLDSGDLDFSFSGLKTEVLYTLRNLKKQNQQFNPADIAASFEQAVVDTLIAKTAKALAEHQPNRLLLAGGVAANERLREHITQLAKEQSLPLHIAPLNLCGDNAVMIGLAALYNFPLGRKQEWRHVDATARINLQNFAQLA